MSLRSSAAASELFGSGRAQPAAVAAFEAEAAATDAHAASELFGGGAPVEAPMRSKQRRCGAAAHN